MKRSGGGYNGYRRAAFRGGGGGGWGEWSGEGVESALGLTRSFHFVSFPSQAVKRYIHIQRRRKGKGEKRLCHYPSPCPFLCLEMPFPKKRKKKDTRDLCLLNQRIPSPLRSVVTGSRKCPKKAKKKKNKNQPPKGKKNFKNRPQNPIARHENPLTPFSPSSTD